MNIRRLAIASAVLLLLGAVLFGGASWYYADRLNDGALAVHSDAVEYDSTATSVTATTVTITGPSGEDWARPGTWGLEWPGGYARLGTIRDTHEDSVTRDYTLVEGTLTPGQAVASDRFAFTGDPLQAHGIPFDEARFTSDAGEFTAWHVAGDPQTWAIFVHGKGSGPAESLRVLPLLHSLGYSALVIHYRNDPGFPPGASGQYDYGASEWRDVEGAATYAIAHGARRFVLVGYSMGGGIVASFLLHSELADRVAAVILDAPMLDFGATIDARAGGQHLPGPLTRFAKWIAQKRYHFDWDGLNYLDSADKLRAPILLFHGTEDSTITIETSQRLAALRPDLVTFVRVEGAPHVGSWNIDPARYEAAVREFLLTALAPPLPGQPP